MPSSTTVPGFEEVADLRRRVGELEARVESLSEQVKAGQSSTPANQWWRNQVGAFADDPAYGEMNRLGREWRESQRPIDTAE